MERKSEGVLFYTYLIFISVLLLVYCFLIPPFRKFDEPGHFQKVMTLASGQLSCRSDASAEDLYLLLPQSVTQFVDVFSRGILEKFPTSLYKQPYPYVHDEAMVKVFDICYLPALGYVPPVIGVIISRPFNNLLVTFFSARFFTMLFFIVCLLLSIKLVPKRYRLLVLLYASLPIVLHQATIVSYDATVISLSILLFSLFVRFLDAKKVSIYQFVVFLLLLAYFLAAKPGYYLFFFLPFWFLDKLEGKKFKRIFFRVFILAGIAVSYFFIRTRLSWLSDEMYFRFMLPLRNPLYILDIFYNSFWNAQDVYLKGIITTVGWFEYDIPLSVFGLYSILFGAVGLDLFQKEKKILSFAPSLMLLFTILCSALLLFYLFYVYATPVGQSFINGTQGRYFVPLILFGFFALSQVLVNVRKRTAIIVGCCIIAAFTVFATVQTVYSRYYDYSGLIRNGTETAEKVKAIEETTGMGNTIMINKPIRHVYTSDDSSKIGGFELFIVNDGKQTVSASYSYKIMDGQCNRVFQSGYLDSDRIRTAGIYREYFRPFEHKEKSLCMEIAPITMTSLKTHLIVLTDGNDIPVVTFLYQLK